jgi:uncharacterized tellurite resistance protein B-like protein
MSWLENMFGIENNHQDFGELFNYIQTLTTEHGEDEAKRITGYAGLLGRVAYADTVITSEEIARIKNILQKESGLKLDAIASIIKLITDRKVEILTIEEHFYARMINEACTMDQKLNLLKNMFEIAAADKNICTAEENLIYQTSESLKIPRADLTKMKRMYAEYLGTLK